jgi:HPt (histidine-containing phosphotransfer) domain-containing protein
MSMQLPPELYQNYHKRRKADLERLRKAAQDNDVEPFNTLGHQLKGNAPTYGYDDLAELGKQMEALSVGELGTKGPQILQAMELWISDTEKRLPV